MGGERVAGRDLPLIRPVGPGWLSSCSPLAKWSAVICVEGYTKAYQTTLAVDDLTFHVEPGQVLGLLGRNGAGKTTTLRALAGIIPPTRGRLSVAGFDLKEQEIEAKRRLAYIPDDPKLFEALTVWEHLEFTAMAYEVADLAERGGALLRQFELESKRDALVQELSRGMRQKVAICCAYLHDPRAILFDEPLTGLDPRGIRTLKESITERARGGAAVMVSSHLLSLVEDLCTHLLVLNLGKACFFGPTEEARRVHPNHRGDASLEEVFFQLTEGAGRDFPDRDGMVPEQPIARSSDEPADGAPEAPAAGDQP